MTSRALTARLVSTWVSWLGSALTRRAPRSASTLMRIVSGSVRSSRPIVCSGAGPRRRSPARGAYCRLKSRIWRERGGALALLDDTSPAAHEWRVACWRSPSSAELDRHQDVVEVVRDAGGELADRGQAACCWAIFWASRSRVTSRITTTAPGRRPAGRAATWNTRRRAASVRDLARLDLRRPGAAPATGRRPRSRRRRRRRRHRGQAGPRKRVGERDAAVALEQDHTLRQVLDDGLQPLLLGVQRGAQARLVDRQRELGGDLPTISAWSRSKASASSRATHSRPMASPPATSGALTSPAPSTSIRRAGTSATAARALDRPAVAVDHHDPGPVVPGSKSTTAPQR